MKSPETLALSDPKTTLSKDSNGNLDVYICVYIIYIYIYIYIYIIFLIVKISFYEIVSSRSPNQIKAFLHLKTPLG